MARYCFLPPTKRPSSTRTQRTKQKEKKSSSMSEGMLKRLEPVFIPKKRVPKKVYPSKNETEIIPNSLKQNVEVKNSVHQTPKKLQPEVKSQQGQKPICRDLFSRKGKEDGRIRNVLEIVDEQNNEGKGDQFAFPSGNQKQESVRKMAEVKDEAERKTDGFKKPKTLPKISKKRKEKQKRINKSVLEIITKTHQSILEIRKQAVSGNTLTGVSTALSQEHKADESIKAKTSFNVQVSICVPNSRIQKSQCTVQQSGSVEEEDIGYKHVGIKRFQNIQTLL